MSDKISLSEVCTRWRAPAEDIFSLVFKEYGFSFFYNDREYSPENEQAHFIYNLSRNNNEEFKGIEFIKDDIDYIENNNDYIKRYKNIDFCKNFDYDFCLRCIHDDIVKYSIRTCLMLRDIINASDYIIKKKDYKEMCNKLIKIYTGNKHQNVDTYIFELFYDEIYQSNKYKPGRTYTVDKTKIFENFDSIICNGIDNLKKSGMYSTDEKKDDNEKAKIKKEEDNKNEKMRKKEDVQKKVKIINMDDLGNYMKNMRKENKKY